mmetsp:Transcript_6701/g.10580  ORF Transcript_6701/g.10580 Transcript_6701/m.10580 type:complete len:134 (+) Transcript_6701:499-900(+)|eukprot:CAMPEP_0203767462 /NCGR_PEP_ID=MMETSP0099_2-20121227/1014_1 /ASSEMBLY_ACC=CAM_ASM_000209 /TAXON_ID=96639 /ORGANISM=" , Strain NY0313808BC1" /LENGTH=133 /DNA_ID=CAMNT_0050663981 /DNA_START=736 /DNA_END=1137 /DNA_ORIENTATION=+
MGGITDLKVLLETMEPRVNEEEYVFCNVKEVDYGLCEKLKPICMYVEQGEGMTLVLLDTVAKENGFDTSVRFKSITLTVHSSLEAVGLTAAVSKKLTEKGVCANVIAAYYHDHVFVPSSKIDLAIAALGEFKK